MGHEDLPRLLAWLQEPHVSPWWVGEPADLAGLTAKYGPCLDGTDPTEMFVIEVAGRPIGMIQRYRIDDHPSWSRTMRPVLATEGVAGIDYLIGEQAATDRGYGSAAIAAFVPLVFERYGAGSIAVAVQQANRASWRALERCGFTRIWAGQLDSDDPSDAGPAFVYQLRRRPATN
jgi:aminoglycoside 6'-N-acetyltransferase